MGEAIAAIVRADALRKASKQMVQEGDSTHYPDDILSDAGVFARYAFLVACNALDNCAFTILQNSAKIDKSMLEELDRLRTLTKFELFAMIHGKPFPRGDDRFGKVRKVIQCRNGFVHPKGLEVKIAEDGKAIGRAAGSREYPLAFDFVEIDHVINMIGDILAFIAWVVFDVTGYGPKEGANLINEGMQEWTMDFHRAQSSWGYDLRSLGDFSLITVTQLGT